MFHDESVGEKKLTLVVVKIFIQKDGVRLRQAVNHSLRPPSVSITVHVNRSILSVGWSVARSAGGYVD